MAGHNYKISLPSCTKPIVPHPKFFEMLQLSPDAGSHVLCEVLSGMANGADVVIVTGPHHQLEKRKRRAVSLRGAYTVESQRGWTVPVDFTLQAGAPFLKKAWTP